MIELDTYQICCSMCSTMVRGIGKEATEQGVKNGGWVLVDGGWWMCDECKPKGETEEKPAGLLSRTCHKCRRVTKASSRYFRLAPRPFECESCLDGDAAASPEVDDQDGIGFPCCRCGKRYIVSSAADACCKPLNAHYKHGSIDPCQYVEAMGDAEYRGACILNILKYITRYPHKGTPMEDLMKAQDYVSRLIEHQKKKENRL